MDDHAYGQALCQELEQLLEDLSDARQVRDHGRRQLENLQKELHWLQNQLCQRQQTLQRQTETVVLQKLVDARKRQKAQLLKELSTMTRERLAVYRQAGLEPNEHPKDAVEVDDDDDASEAQTDDEEEEEEEGEVDEARISNTQESSTVEPDVSLEKTAKTRASRQKKSHPTALLTTDNLLETRGVAPITFSPAGACRRRPRLSRRDAVPSHGETHPWASPAKRDAARIQAATKACGGETTTAFYTRCPICC
jgi:hypothetical protein